MFPASKWEGGAGRPPVAASARSRKATDISDETTRKPKEIRGDPLDRALLVRPNRTVPIGLGEVVPLRSDHQREGYDEPPHFFVTLL
jgi:hypothetical protein